MSSVKECSIISCHQSQPLYQYGGVSGYGFTITQASFTVEEQREYGRYYMGMVVFKTPPSAIFNKKVTVNILGANLTTSANLTINYAISSSDVYKNVYASSCCKTVTGDTYQLGSGSFYMPYENKAQKIYSFVLDEVELNADTTYYLFMWLGGKSYPSDEIYSQWTATFDSSELHIIVESESSNEPGKNGTCICIKKYILSNCTQSIVVQEDMVNFYKDVYCDTIIDYIESNTELLIDGIEKSKRNGEVLFHTVYNGKAGYVSSSNTSYTISVDVVNESGVALYDSPGGTVHEYLPYGSQIVFSNDNNDMEIYDNDIWLYTSYVDNDGSEIIRCAKMSDAIQVDNYYKYISATPHISIYHTDSWDGLFTARTQTSLNLRKGPGTNYDIIASIPSGTDMVVDMIKKSSTDNYAWCRTTYNNDIAWCSLYNSSYTVYARVTNPNGACGYKVLSESDIRLMSECAFPYGSEIVISTEDNHSFTVAEDYSTTNRIIYGETYMYYEDGTRSACHVMMSDVEILSERTYMTFVPAIPHISIRKTECWDGLFEATVNTSDPELYLRSNTSTNYSNLGTIPNETKLTIDDVVIADDGTTILGRTSYNGQTGYANFEYLDYEIYAKVSNPDGAPFYTNKELTNTWTDLSHIAYEKEVLISSNSYCGLVAYNGKILGNLYVIDSDSSRLGGFVRMDDLEYLSERIYYDWVCVMA